MCYSVRPSKDCAKYFFLFYFALCIRATTISPVCWRSLSLTSSAISFHFISIVIVVLINTIQCSTAPHTTSATDNTKHSVSLVLLYLFPFPDSITRRPYLSAQFHAGHILIALLQPVTNEISPMINLTRCRCSFQWKFISSLCAWFCCVMSTRAPTTICM